MDFGIGSVRGSNLGGICPQAGLANGQSELASVHTISVMDSDSWYLLSTNGIEHLGHCEKI
jgi:hypothetical protein